MEKANVHMI